MGFLAKPLAVYFNSITESSDFSRPPKSEINDNIADLDKASNEDLFELLMDNLSSVLNRMSSHFGLLIGSKAKLDELIEALEEIVHLHTGDVLEEFSLSAIKKNLLLNDSLPIDIQKSPEFEKIKGAMYWAFQEVETAPGTDYFWHKENTAAGTNKNPSSRLSLRGVYLFFLTLKKSERDIYSVLLQDYHADGSPDHPKPIAIVSVMMDMEKAYRKYSKWSSGKVRPKWEFFEQISRVKALAKETPGEIIPIAAVDPFRKNWRDYMDFAVARGIKKFKMYPPLGFRAKNIKNYKSPLNPKHMKKRPIPKPNSKKVNNVVRDILKKSNDEELRIFTHCTPIGFEAVKGYGYHADPAFWNEAINANNLKDLWLCLGHGGGTTPQDWLGWAASDKNWKKTYAYRVVQMCRTHKNVYCDLGYLLDLFEDGTKSKARILKRLKSELIKTDGGPYCFSSKVMYGTDWHMMSAIGRTREYLDIFYKFFDDQKLEKYAEGFFSANAKRYLDI